MLDYEPVRIGGMGVGVTNPVTAQHAAQCISPFTGTGHEGTVSLTGCWLEMIRRLQLGDPDGQIRRALSHFPSKRIREWILAKYYIPEGEIQPVSADHSQLFAGAQVLSYPLRRETCELMMAGSYVYVWLAKEGHRDVPIAINLLEKMQLTILHCLFGAMLAGLNGRDTVMMGAGIPIQVAAALNRLADGKEASYRITIDGADPHDVYAVHLDPHDCGLDELPPLQRPRWVPIISLDTLAKALAKRSEGGIEGIDGYYIENPRRGPGGHVPSPRGGVGADGVVRFSERDEAKLDEVLKEGKPVWLAGNEARPTALAEALDRGAAGIGIGSIVALSEASGILHALKEGMIRAFLDGTLKVRYDAHASPSGYPFAVVEFPGTVLDPATLKREAVCDIGALATPYLIPGSKKVGMRCTAAPAAYVRTGGLLEDTIGKLCLCNGLLAAVGFGQVRYVNGMIQVELPLLTLGFYLDFLYVLGRNGVYTLQAAYTHMGA